MSSLWNLVTGLPFEITASYSGNALLVLVAGPHRVHPRHWQPSAHRPPTGTEHPHGVFSAHTTQPSGNSKILPLSAYSIPSPPVQGTGQTQTRTGKMNLHQQGPHRTRAKKSSTVLSEVSLHTDRTGRCLVFIKRNFHIQNACRYSKSTVPL